MSFQAVIFSLGSEEYGIPIGVVQEITRLAGVHPIPKAPDYVKGLISIRGQAIPLIDMHIKFGIGTENKAEYAILVEIDGNLVGMAVDEVKEVRTIEEVSPPPPLVTAPFIGGIINLPNRIIVQIRPDKILENVEVKELCELIR